MRIGYARVSTQEQSLDLQLDALRDNKVRKTYEDICSGKIGYTDRPGLSLLLDTVRDGDVIVVWKLDRLGRSLHDLIGLVRTLENLRVGFQVLEGPLQMIDTSTPGGKLIFSVFAALSEFERDVIVERTNAGLKAARKRGRIGGRRPALNAVQSKMLRIGFLDESISIHQLCQEYKISRTTLYNYVRKENAKEAIKKGKPNSEGKENVKLAELETKATIQEDKEKN